MTAEELIRDGRDPSISDEDIYRAIEEYTLDESHDIQDVRDLGRAMEDIRPNVMNRFRDFVLFYAQILLLRRS